MLVLSITYISVSVYKRIKELNTFKNDGTSDGIVPKIINFFNLIKCKNNCLTILNNEYTGMVSICEKLQEIATDHLSIYM